VNDPGRQAVRLDQQASREVRGLDLLRSPARGDPAGRGQDVARAAGAPGEVGALPARDDALLRGLPGHAHAAADLAPRRSRAPGLVHEVPDQRVGLLARH
jgi:hypothetical protein